MINFIHYLIINLNYFFQKYLVIFNIQLTIIKIQVPLINNHVYSYKNKENLDRFLGF